MPKQKQNPSLVLPEKDAIIREKDADVRKKMVLSEKQNIFVREKEAIV